MCRPKKIKVSGAEYRIGDGIISSNENDVYRVGQILNKMESKSIFILNSL